MTNKYIHNKITVVYIYKIHHNKNDSLRFSKFFDKSHFERLK